MRSVQYLALLRGINVGGRNIIKMADLKACIAAVGCEDVTTYIQSGNVLFRSPIADSERVAAEIERALDARFGYASRVVVLTHGQLAEVVAQAPAGFGDELERFRYDVIFLKAPLTAAAAMRDISIKPGVDSAASGARALYFSRLISKASQSHLSRIVALPVYQSMTIRNWNTTTKLLALMERAADRG